VNASDHAQVNEDAQVNASIHGDVVKGVRGEVAAMANDDSETMI